MADIRALMGNVGTAVDAAGVIVIAVGVLIATVHLILSRQEERGRSYQLYRQDLGRAILLGLRIFNRRRHHSHYRVNIGERYCAGADRGYTNFTKYCFTA